MELFLTLLSGIGWIIVYEECIRLGLKEKTYAMPFWALALNITWEITYTYSDIFLGAHGEMGGMLLAQTIVNIFWVIFDCVILYTYFKYGRKEWVKQVKSCFFVPYSLLVLVCSMALQFVFIQEFGFGMAAQYSAFLQNLLMSVLFIGLFLKRNSMEGTSLILAFAKWIGTLAPTILMGIITFNPVVLICGLFCCVFDLIYITLLIHYRKEKKENITS